MGWEPASSYYSKKTKQEEDVILEETKGRNVSSYRYIYHEKYILYAVVPRINQGRSCSSYLTENRVFKLRQVPTAFMFRDIFQVDQSKIAEKKNSFNATKTEGS